MLTRRDLTVALASTALTLAAVASLPARASVLGSTIFDWNSLKAQPNDNGEVRRVVQSPTATLDELEMHITTLKPGVASHAPHKHPAEEVIILKEGAVESFLNGKWERVAPGSIIFQASNELHALRNAGDTPATYFVIQWQPPGMLKKSSGR